jgi:hypothetical protein
MEGFRGEDRHNPWQLPLRAHSRCHRYAARFVLTARTKITDRMLIVGQRHLRTILVGYEAHYNRRGRQLRPPRPDHPVADLSRKQIERRPVLGGLIS